MACADDHPEPFNIHLLHLCWLQGTYRAAESRMTQESLRRHVLRVLRVWRERFIFSDDYLNGLQVTFLKPPIEAVSDGQTDDADIENSQLRAELEAMPEEDLERKCRLSGLVGKGGRELCIQRLIALDNYLNAENRVAAGVSTTGVPLARGSSVVGSGNAVAPVLAAAAAPVLVTPTTGVNLDTGVDNIFGDGASLDSEGGGPGMFGVSAPPAGPSQTQQELSSASAAAPGIGSYPLHSNGPINIPGVAVVKPEGGGGAGEAAGAGWGAAPVSRWQVVDEELERQQAPQVPVSKWLLEEQEAQAEAARRQVRCHGALFACRLAGLVLCFQWSK